MSSTTTARTAAAGPGGAGPLKLKFIFANYDGVVVEYQAEPSTKIKDLKAELVGRWPSGSVCVRGVCPLRLPTMHTSTSHSTTLALRNLRPKLYVPPLALSPLCQVYRLLVTLFFSVV